MTIDQNVINGSTHHAECVDDVLGRGLVPGQVVDDIVHLEVSDLRVGATPDPAIHQTRCPQTHCQSNNLKQKMVGLNKKDQN